MNYTEKKELLEHAKELARNLEDVTTEFVEVQLGWIDANGQDLALTIMINHDESFFGSYEILGWNENVVFNNINNLHLLSDPYIRLNELIEKAYQRSE